MGATDERATVLALIEDLKQTAGERLNEDRVRTLGTVEVSPKLIDVAVPFKEKTPHAKRIHMAMHRGGFIAPIIVSEDLLLIDGAERVTFAKRHKVKTLQALVVEASDSQAAYLRLVLNKSAEFQRWKFDEVVPWLARPDIAEAYLTVVEPLGIFGERIIPQSFLGNSVVEYRIDADAGIDSQQAEYKQEPGLAKWAAMARNEQQAHEEWVAELAKYNDKPARDAPEPFRSPVASTFYPAYPLGDLNIWDAMKRRGWQHKKARKRSIGVTGFVPPIIADTSGRVIDGALTLEIVRELHDEGWWPEATLPVVVVQATDDLVTYLRIVLNRTAELPRWNYPDIEHFVDAHPQLAPLCEPFGLFTEAVLPRSAWAATALRFEAVSPLKDALYDPSTMELQQWADINRQRMAFERTEKDATPLKPAGDYAPLFEMEWVEGELLPVHDVQAAVRADTLKMRDVAETITETYDKKRRKEKDLAGQDWQTSRRNKRDS